MNARITKAYIRHYRDNGQTKVYVEWRDQRDRAARTEGAWPTDCALMDALLQRCHHEGVPIEQEVW